MKKILFFLMILISFNSFSMIFCPQTLICDYEKGSCNISSTEWLIQAEGSLPPFNG